MSGQQENAEVKSFENYSGPDLEYGWYVEVSRDPSPKGLEGGCIQYMSVVKYHTIDQSPAVDPEIFDPSKAQPRFTQVARYMDGTLTCDHADEHAATIVQEVKETFQDRNNMYFQSWPEREKEVPTPRVNRSSRTKVDERER